jgi:hypothetical protein
MISATQTAVIEKEIKNGYFKTISAILEYKG